MYAKSITLTIQDRAVNFQSCPYLKSNEPAFKVEDVVMVAPVVFELLQTADYEFLQILTQHLNVVEVNKAVWDLQMVLFESRSSRNTS